MKSFRIVIRKFSAVTGRADCRYQHSFLCTFYYVQADSTGYDVDRTSLKELRSGRSGRAFRQTIRAFSLRELRNTMCADRDAAMVLCSKRCW